MRIKKIALFTILTLNDYATAQTYDRFKVDRDFGRFEGSDATPLSESSRYAQVLSSRQVTRRIKVVEKETRCDTVVRHVETHRRDRSASTGAIVGGVVGAVVGNNVVSRKHRGLGTVGGAIVGSAIGKGLAESANQEPEVVQEVRECVEQPVERWREEIVGYQVTYLYAGRRYSTDLSYNPGDRLKVDLAGRPN